MPASAVVSDATTNTATPPIALKYSSTSSLSVTWSACCQSATCSMSGNAGATASSQWAMQEPTTCNQLHDDTPMEGHFYTCC
jgi:hypothetical protein